MTYDCWRAAGTWNTAGVTPTSRAAGRRANIAAYEAGYTLFDNADIYCRGEAERILGEALGEVPGMRRRVCGTLPWQQSRTPVRQRNCQRNCLDLFRVRGKLGATVNDLNHYKNTARS